MHPRFGESWFLVGAMTGLLYSAMVGPVCAGGSAVVRRAWKVLQGKSTGRGQVEQVLRSLENAAGKGDLGAAILLGRAFDKGWKVEADPERGGRWFERACAGGSAEACVRRGRQLRGVEYDPLDDVETTTMTHWFEKAARAGTRFSIVHVVGADWALPRVPVRLATEVLECDPSRSEEASERGDFACIDYPEGVRFSLQGAPEGMVIDSRTGAITWVPRPEHGGKRIRARVLARLGSEQASFRFSREVRETKRLRVVDRDRGEVPLPPPLEGLRLDPGTRGSGAVEVRALVGDGDLPAHAEDGPVFTVSGLVGKGRLRYRGDAEGDSGGCGVEIWRLYAPGTAQDFYSDEVEENELSSNGTNSQWSWEPLLANEDPWEEGDPCLWRVEDGIYALVPAPIGDF